MINFMSQWALAKIKITHEKLNFRCEVSLGLNIFSKRRVHKLKSYILHEVDGIMGKAHYFIV